MRTNVSENKVEKLSFSDFMNNVEEGRIITAKIDGNEVRGEQVNTSGKTKYKTNIFIEYPDFIKILRKNGVKIEVESLNNYLLLNNL